MIITMVIYADTIFAMNTAANFLLLSAYRRLCNMPRRLRKTTAAAAAGGAYASIEAALALPHILRAPLLCGMAYAAFGRRGIIKHTSRLMLLCFAVEGITLAAVSAVGAAAELAQGGVVIFASEPFTAAVYILAYPAFFLINKIRQKEKKYIRLRLTGNGGAAEFPVLRDSGNLLRYKDMPVIMAAWEAAAPVTGCGSYRELKENAPGYVMYRTLSGAGVLPVIDVRCEADGAERRAAVAVVERRFKGKYYGLAGDIDSI